MSLSGHLKNIHRKKRVDKSVQHKSRGHDLIVALAKLAMDVQISLL